MTATTAEAPAPAAEPASPEQGRTGDLVIISDAPIGYKILGEVGWRERYDRLAKSVPWPDLDGHYAGRARKDEAAAMRAIAVAEGLARRDADQQAGHERGVCAHAWKSPPERYDGSPYQHTGQPLPPPLPELAEPPADVYLIPPAPAAPLAPLPQRWERAMDAFDAVHDAQAAPAGEDEPEGARDHPEAAEAGQDARKRKPRGGRFWDVQRKLAARADGRFREAAEDPADEDGEQG